LLIKNKHLTTKYFIATKIFLNKFLKIVGFFSCLLIIIFLSYYFSSGMSQRYGAKIFFTKVNTLVFVQYLGVDFFKLDQYLKILKIKTKSLISKPKIDKIQLEVNQKTIFQIEKQRQIKIKNDLDAPKFSMHNILIIVNDIRKKAKIRVKGDRAIHWQNKNTTSFKIDMRGNNRIWGMEEFSIQKPIARNYTYEYLYHKFLEEAGHLSLKYFFVNLHFNDEDRGLYAIEESFSKELLERQKKRNGPIFGIDETISGNYPNTHYDLYSSEYWLREYPNLIKSAFSILNDIRDNEKDLKIEDHFDLDKWASFFALTDVTGTYHGSISKSVKLYFNPTTAKFEPIGFDGHYSDNDLNDFILTDFLQEGPLNCSYLCRERNWYLKFFKLKNGSLNYSFINKYVFYLKKYSNKKYLKNFLEKNKEEINTINTLIYSENSKSDRGLWKGISTFIYDEQYIYKRSQLIKSRINSVNFKNYKLSLEKDILYFKDTNSRFPVYISASECDILNKNQNRLYLSGNMKVRWLNNCNKIILKNYKDEHQIFVLKQNISMQKGKKILLPKKFDDLTKNVNVDMVFDNQFVISKNLDLVKNTHIAKKYDFVVKKGVAIKIRNDATLFIEGNIKFEGEDESEIKIKSDGSGSIVFFNNNVEIKHMNIENLGFPKIDRYILYAGLNFINTNSLLENVSVKNSKSEDAINFVNSKVFLKDIYFENIKSDALDIDSGIVKFDKIVCKKINNDCLDISGSNTSGNYLDVDNSLDKGLSVGENSYVEIKNLIIKNSKLGFAIKDGSKVYLENVELVNNQYDIAIFNKKQEFETPSLEVKNFLNEKKKILQSKNSKLIINETLFLGKDTNKYINSLIY
jgi:hypothetical protein